MTARSKSSALCWKAIFHRRSIRPLAARSKRAAVGRTKCLTGNAILTCRRCARLRVGIRSNAISLRRSWHGWSLCSAWLLRNRRVELLNGGRHCGPHDCFCKGGVQPPFLLRKCQPVWASQEIEEPTNLGGHLAAVCIDRMHVISVTNDVIMAMAP